MESKKSRDGSSINMVTRGGRGGGRGCGDYQDQYRDHRYEYEQRNNYGPGGYDRNNYDQCNGGRGRYGGAMAMAAKTLKETILTIHLEPMIPVRYVARWVTLH
jgi:hypothetical protein